MTAKVKFTFNEVANDKDPGSPPGGLTLAIRADEHDATAGIKKNLIEYLKQSPQQRAFFNTIARKDHLDFEKEIEDVVHEAYRAWVYSVLGEIARGLDYSRYNLNDDPARILNVNSYNAHELAQSVVQKGEQLVRQGGDVKPGLPILYVSLDDMIGAQSEHWGEIAFSRQFSLDGDQQLGYQARPGKNPIEDQMRELAEFLEKLKAQYGEDIPIVLIEDNVRHAKMLNWVIDLMEQNKVFAAGKLAGIATCFCVATEEERQKILHRGQVVPLAAVVDFKDSLTDVVTPRDLLFDGFVVQVEDSMTRLPGIFMNVEKLFKLSPDKVDDFRTRINLTNIEFCEQIEKEFGVAVPLGWFPGAAAISHVTGFPPETPMAEVIRGQQDSGRTPAKRPCLAGGLKT
jgi:hypothetical protein